MPYLLFTIMAILAGCGRPDTITFDEYTRAVSYCLEHNMRPNIVKRLSTGSFELDHGTFVVEHISCATNDGLDFPVPNSVIYPHGRPIKVLDAK